MKNFLLVFVLLSTSLFHTDVLAYELQGTTVKKDKCNVAIIIQIGVETDTLSDITRIQTVADECFSITCDLPCEDGKVGKCSVTSKVIVVNWASLSIQDKDKFHHVTMLPGEGVSSVSGRTGPNKGKTSTGRWFRHESPDKVYCHEIWHLAGLPDRYRDCRRRRIALGVDNCKDGKQCTEEQIRRGACPSCDGHEHDCMGNDVTLPASCAQNVMEVVRLANDITLVCSEECCTTRTRRPEEDPRTSGPQVGAVLDAGVGLYNQRHKEFKDDKLNMMGGAFSLGGYGLLPLMTNAYLMAYLKLNYAAVGKKRTETTGTGMTAGTTEETFRYRFADLSLGANFIYQFQLLSLYAGPEVAFILMAKYKNFGSYTYNGVTTPIGDETWRNIADKKNIQLGVNLGAMYRLMLMRQAMMVYLNFYYPFTNYIAYEFYRNRLYNINLGLMLPLKYMNNSRPSD